MDAQKLVIYIMYPKEEDDHPFLIIRQTIRKPNKAGKYTTGPEILKVGVLWPTPVAKSRDDLASLIGRAILDEVESGAKVRKTVKGMK